MSYFLNFYLENNLHPLNQDISDLKLHYKRRIDLYRKIGLPQIVFNSKDVLEVAPSSGYNSFVSASLGLKSFDLLEPNITGYNEMLSLFNKMDITEKKT